MSDGVRSVLVHAYALGLGGLERVVVMQCAIFREMGLKVNLLLSTPLPSSHYPLPEGIAVRLLPPARPDCPEEVRVRERALLEVVRETGADIYLDSAYLNLVTDRPIVLCDWSALKEATNVRVLVHWHSIFSRFLREPGGAQSARNLTRALRLCDGVIVLSRVDRLFFSGLGCRAWYLPNPVDAALVRASRAPVRGTHGGKTVLWCGRLADVKRPLAALAAFAEARARVPDAKLIMVGGGNDALFERMNRFVDERGLRDCVTMTGELTETYSQYAAANVFFSTSTCEGYPMSFVEAYAFSLPIVSTGKGYLELLRESAGAAIVVDDDVQEAGRALADILGDEERLGRMRTAAASVWRNLCEFDLSQAYGEIFDELCRESSREPSVGEDERLMIRELVCAVPVGAEATFRRDLARLRRAGTPFAVRIMKILFKGVSLLLAGRVRRAVRSRRNACNEVLEWMGEMQ